MNISIICGQYITFSLLFLKVEDISWLSIFPATTSLPAISRPNSIVRLWAIQTTTQAEQHSQKRAPIAHGHPTGRPTGIIISLTMVDETKLEWWATSYAWLACRRWGGSKEVTGAKVWCESPGTPRTWGLDISNLYEYGRSSCKSILVDFVDGTCTLREGNCKGSQHAYCTDCGNGKVICVDTDGGSCDAP